jgi:hypothetical protein
MILNKEMLEAKDFFAPATTYEGVIITSGNRTCIFVK